MKKIKQFLSVVFWYLLAGHVPVRKLFKICAALVLCSVCALPSFANYDSAIQGEWKRTNRFIYIGNVVAVSSGSITVSSGTVKTIFTLGERTHIRKNGQKATLANLKPGDRALVHYIVIGEKTILLGINAITKGGKPYASSH